MGEAVGGRPPVFGSGAAGGALAAGALVAHSVIGFLAVPLGDVEPLAKYAHNTVFFAGSVLLGVWATRRARPAGDAGR